MAGGPGWAVAPAKKPVEHHTLSGTVSGLAPGHHAMVKANKVYSKEIHTTTTRPDGGYTLRGLTPGSYTVRPSHSGYHFYPNFHSVVVRDSDRVGIDFTAAPTAPPKKR
jgi:hypothetical protein